MPNTPNLPPIEETTPITEILERNALLYGSDVCLVEINPEVDESRRITWKDFDLVQPSKCAPSGHRRSTTWSQFNALANRFANLLLSRGLKKGDKVGILLMNCLEWLPVYFGALKAGGVAVPLNFRYASDEIKYCVGLADVDFLVFGPEFIGRMEAIADQIPRVRGLFFLGENCPSFAEPFHVLTSYCSSQTPDVKLTCDDEAAIYFSSGTTGFPKAILHPHRSLTSSCFTEQNHHKQTRADVFLCIPPLYHTGAKMHWFGSFLVGGKAVLLKGVKPQTILHAVSEERCTIVWLLVPWAQDILDAIESKQVDLSEYVLEQWRL
ncbi:MAG: AMP-binding protein, partial [Thermoguttaceae bacterium]|nr:AMP-binding protein [Thermoguttaceae bacterium]